MDGYSVQEAASVLGVAEGRVWELLARGVLLGTPEGDSMRVFLQGQPGPIATAGTHDEPPRTNGNGGSHGSTGEASAFRELLTEFRNLTERYGQALLALGEARGEVAGLRSRVDLLEARLDLRLPQPLDAAPVAWEPSTASEVAAEPSPPTPPAAPLRALPRRRTQPRKARSPREAVAGFADALARAQDPNAAELGEAPAQADADAGAVAPPLASEAALATEQPTVGPLEVAAVAAAPVGGEEAAVELPEAGDATDEALAAADMGADAAAAVERAAEQPAAEDQSVEVEPPTYSTVVVEPDWFADGDFAWLDAAEMEASGRAEAVPAPTESPAPRATAEEPQAAAEEPQATAEEPQATAEEPQATAEEPQATAEEPQATAEEPQEAAEGIAPQPEPQATEDLEATQDLEATEDLELPAPPVEETQPPPLPEPLPELLAEPLPEPLPVFEAETEFEPWQPPEPPPAEVAAEPQAADTLDLPPVTTAVAVDDVEEEVMWLGAEPEPSPVVLDEPRPGHPVAADAWPAVDMAAPVAVVRPPLAMTEDELARLALDEGWDDAEVAAIRAMITPMPTSRVDLPGAAELNEAMAALEAVPVRSDPAYDVSRQWAKAAPDDEAPAPRGDWAFDVEPAPPSTASQPATDLTSALRRTASDPGWLRRRQGPAAAAYRRLRRLFPG